MKTDNRILSLCAIFIMINFLSFAVEDFEINAGAEDTTTVEQQHSGGGSTFSIGEELFSAGKIEEAAKVFSRSDSSENVMGAATCYRLIGNYKASISYYSILIDRKVYLSEAYFGRGLAYRGAEDYTKAIADLKTSLVLQKNPYTYAGLGDIYILVGKDGDAKSILEEGNRLYPESALIKKLLLRAYKN